jgi:hypothetical protein
MARLRARLSSLALAVAVALLVALGVYSQHNAGLQLDRFEPAVAETRAAAAPARLLTRDNPEQQARLGRFEPLLARRLASLESSYGMLRDTS